MKIGVKNFRVFKELQTFEIQPITVLVGPNSSGKSSLTKLLLLLREGINPLDFTMGEHNLEDFKNTLNWEFENDFLVFRFYNVIPILGSSLIEIKYKSLTPYSMTIYGPDDMELFSIFQIDDKNKGKYTWSLQLRTIQKLFIEKELYFHGKSVTDHYNSLYKKLTDQFIEYGKFIDFDENKKFNINMLNMSTLDRFIEDINEVETKIDFVNFIERTQKQNKQANDYKKIDKEELFLIALYHSLNELNKDSKIYEVHIGDDQFRKEIHQAYEESIDEIEKGISDFNFKNFDDLFFNLQYLLVSALNEQPYYKTSTSNLSEKELDQIFYEFDVNGNKSLLGKLVFKYKLPKSQEKFVWDNMIGDIVSLKQMDFTFIDMLTREALNKVKIILRNIKYISANRSGQKRVLLNTGETQVNSIVKRFSENTDKLKEYVHDALEIFNVLGEICIDRYENAVSIISIVDEKNNKVNLADIGFGYSQIIPVILEIVNSTKGEKDTDQILIIEEPEANLHPEFQSKIADLMLLTIRTFPNFKIIIETHSEYFIRKLQYLVAKNELTTSDTIIHYFNSEENVTPLEPKVKHITILEDGNLSDTFGPGFYDEATRLQFELLRLNQEQSN